MGAENIVIKNITKWVEERGGHVYNYPGGSAYAELAFPDKIVVLPFGTFFVETKAPNEVPRKNQSAKIKEINRFGGRAFWTDSLDDFIDKVYNLTTNP